MTIDTNDYTLINKEGEIVNLKEIIDNEIRELVEKQNKQKDSYKEKLSREEKSNINFVNHDYNSIDEIMKLFTRGQRGYFLVLSCYVCYSEKGNKLVHQNGKPLTKNTMLDILNCSGKSLKNFLEICTNNEIFFYSEKEKCYSINPKYSFKGGYKNKRDKVVSFMTDTIISAIENEELKPSQLGFLYDIQKYLNMDTMLLCENPNEKVFENLRPLNQKQLAKLMNMTEQQLLKQLNNLKVNKTYIVTKIKCYGSARNEHRILINPDFVFRGNYNACIETVKKYGNSTTKAIFSKF